MSDHNRSDDNRNNIMKYIALVICFAMCFGFFVKIVWL